MDSGSNVGGGPDGQAAPTTTEASSAATTTPNTADAGEAWRNPAEIKKALQDLRAVKAELAALKQAAPTPQPREPKAPADEFAEIRQELTALRRERALTEALAEKGAGLTKAQRQLVTRMFASVEQDANEFLDEILPAFGSAKADASPPPQAAPRTNSGALSAPDKAMVPDDLRMIPPDVWRSLSREEKLAKFDGMLAKAGVIGNRFAKPARK